MANAAIVILDLGPPDIGSVAPTEVPRAAPPRRLVDSPWALAPIVLAIAAGAATDARGARPPAADTNQPWTAAPLVATFTAGAWLDLQSAATGQSSAKTRVPSCRPVEPPWSIAPIVTSAGPWTDAHAERTGYRPPIAVPEPWLSPPLVTSASPWEQTENPDRSTWTKPRQPDETWAQPPIKLLRWDGDEPERSTYRRAKQPDFEPWGLAPVAVSASPWEESEDPERTTYTKPRAINEPWSQAPIVLGRWDAASPERTGYCPPRQPPEAWSAAPLVTSASPWEESENPERSGYARPRQPDEAWSFPPVTLGRFDGDQPERSRYHAAHQQDAEAWTQAPITLSGAPWEICPTPPRSTAPPRSVDSWTLQPLVVAFAAGPWLELAPQAPAKLAPAARDGGGPPLPVLVASAAPWSTQDQRAARAPRPLDLEPWTQNPIRLSRWDGDLPQRVPPRRLHQADYEPWALPVFVAGASPWEETENPERPGYARPRQPDEPWSSRPLTLSGAPWEHVSAERSPWRHAHSPDFDGWTGAPLLVSLVESAAPAPSRASRTRDADPWALQPLVTAFAPAPWLDLATITQRRVQRAAADSSSTPLPPLVTSSAPWGSHDGRRGQVGGAGIRPTEPWALPPSVAPLSAVAWATQDHRQPPRSRSSDVESWVLGPVTLPLADPTQAPNVSRLTRQPDVEPWQQRSLGLVLSAAPWATQECARPQFHQLRMHPEPSAPLAPQVPPPSAKPGASVLRVGLASDGRTRVAIGGHAANADLLHNGATGLTVARSDNDG